MADEDLNKGEGQEDTPPDGASTTEEGKKQGPPETVPYDRLQEVIAERNSLRGDIETLQKEMQKLVDQREADRTKKMEENEEFKELADEWKGKFTNLETDHQNTAQALEAHQEALARFADSQMERVPELYRDVVEKMPLLERLTWLSEKAEKLEEQSKSAAIPRTPKGQGLDKIPDDERRRRAAKTF